MPPSPPTPCSRVVEPMMNGLGGDLFVMYWEANTGKLDGLERLRRRAAALSPEFLAKQGIKSMPAAGIHSCHGARRGGRLGQDPPALREAALEGSVPGRDRVRRTGIPGDRSDPGVLGRECGPSQAAYRIPASVSAGREGAESRRPVQESRYGTRFGSSPSKGRRRSTRARSPPPS